MKKSVILLLVIVFNFTVIFGQEPAISFTTTKAIGSSIKFTLKAAADSTPVQIDFGDGNLVDTIVNTVRIDISSTIFGSQTIKIYGTGITEFLCYSSQLTTIDVSKCTEIQLLYLENNLISSLDISNNLVLTYLHCKTNNLTTLDIRSNKALSFLNCDENKLTSLDLSMNTSLATILCRYNSLTALDVSKDTALLQLYCGSNLIAALDVTNNPKLSVLWCADNLIETLDVSKNPALRMFYCFNNQLTELDLSKNLALDDLACYSNSLSALDLSNNPNLRQLMCSYTNITSLDLSNKPKLNYIACEGNKLKYLVVENDTSLTNLYCKGNFLNFATLPVKQAKWTNYLYAPQMAIQIDKVIPAGLPVVFSNQAIVDTDTTVFIWKTLGGDTLIEGIDYLLSNGITEFLKEQTDSVYCELTNKAFPDLSGANVLRTTNAIIRPVPAIIMVTDNVAGTVFDFSLGGAAENTPVQIGFGDAPVVYDTIGTSLKNISGTLLNSQTIAIYGNGISYLLCANRGIVYLNVSNDQALNHITCDYNRLESIDVSKNTALISLSIGNNLLTSLDVSKNTSLTSLNCEENRLSELDVTADTALIGLWCMKNKIAVLDISKNNKLTQLSCDFNLLTEIDLSANTALEYFSCSENNISLLDISNNMAIMTLGCENNNLTLTTLPLTQTQWEYYSYAPQKPMDIVKTLEKNLELDLSSQLSVNGTITVYRWKTQSGSTLIENTDYTISDGKTIFLKGFNDSVYCEMTNTAYPDFSGEKVFKTTNIKITGFTAVEDNLSYTPVLYSVRNTLFIDIAYDAQLTVYDLTGRMVISKCISGGTNSIPLQKGCLYIVKINGKEGLITRKTLIM